MAAIGRFQKGNEIFHAKVVDGELFRLHGEVIFRPCRGWKTFAGHEPTVKTVGYYRALLRSFQFEPPPASSIPPRLPCRNISRSRSLGLGIIRSGGRRAGEPCPRLRPARCRQNALAFGMAESYKKLL